MSKDENYFLLGIVGSKVFNIKTKVEEYAITHQVPEEIINWLNSHDIRIGSKGEIIYICNAVEYEFLGPVPQKVFIPTGEKGEA